MSEPKFFNKVKVTDSKDLKITSTSIFKNHLIIGDASGGIHSYEITSKNKLLQVGEISLKNKIEQIVTFTERSLCFF